MIRDLLTIAWSWAPAVRFRAVIGDLALVYPVDSGEDDCGHEPDVDGPEYEAYVFGATSLAAKFEEACHRGNNGGDPEEVGPEMVRELELGHLEDT